MPPEHAGPPAHPGRPERRGAPLSRSDLPAELTPETLRTVPVMTLRRFADPRNHVLDSDEQQEFDTAMHEMMSVAARRLSRQVDPVDWQWMMTEAGRGRTSRSMAGRSQGRGGRPTAEQRRLHRIAERIGEQVDLAEQLAPGVDWSFAQPPALEPGRPMQPPAAQQPAAQDAAAKTLPAHEHDAGASSSGRRLPTGSHTPDESGDGFHRTTTSTIDVSPVEDIVDAADDATIDDLEAELSDQMGLVEVMSDIAEVSRRTFALEQQRELSNTRGVFFGFLVSVAVIAAGWAPVVAMSWPERWWTLALTVATCAVAGLVYMLILHRQRTRDADADDTDSGR